MSVGKIFVVTRARSLSPSQLQFLATFALAQRDFPVTGWLEIRYLLRIIGTSFRVIGWLKTSNKLTRSVGSGFVVVITDYAVSQNLLVDLKAIEIPFKVLPDAITYLRLVMYLLVQVTAVIAITFKPLPVVLRYMAKETVVFLQRMRW